MPSSRQDRQDNVAQHGRLCRLLTIGKGRAGKCSEPQSSAPRIAIIGAVPTLLARDGGGIPTETVRDLRDRALIATLTYSFGRIGAALKMKVEDLRSKGAGWQIRLHEKGGREHAMPCHHALSEALHAYIAATGIAEDRKVFLFRTSSGHAGAAYPSGR